MIISINISTARVEAKGNVKIKSITVKSPVGSKKVVYVAKGKKVSLSTTVKVSPNKKKYRKVKYKSYNKKIAKVTSKGKIKGVKVGKTKIKVISKTNPQKHKTIKVKVTKPVKKISFKSSKLTIKYGESKTIAPLISAPKGAFKKLTWKSSNPKVVRVSGNGVISGLSCGTATITVRTVDGTNKKASCKITIENGIKSAKFLGKGGTEKIDMFRITLLSPQKLEKEDIKVFSKSSGAKQFSYQEQVRGVVTSDNMTYDVFLKKPYSYNEYKEISPLQNGDCIRVEIPKVNATKELQFLRGTLEHYMVYPAIIGNQAEELKIEFINLTERYRAEVYKGTLPKGLKLTGSNHNVISGQPTEIADNQIVTFKGIDDLGNVAYTKVNFIIGSKNKLIVEKRTVGAMESDVIYSNTGDMESNSPMKLYVQGGSGSYNIELLDTLDRALELKYNTTSQYAQVKRFASNTLLPVGTHTVRVKFTDQKNENLSIIGSLKIIVSPIYELSITVKNAYKEDDIILYNRYTGKDYRCVSFRSDGEQQTITATFKVVKGDYMIYSRSYGEMCLLAMNQSIAQDKSLGYTLGKRAQITGKIFDKSGDSYSGSVRVSIYNITDTEWPEAQYGYCYSSNVYSKYHLEENKYYKFEGVPDGKYIIEVYYSDEHTYQTKITVKGKNVVCDMKTNLGS